MKSLALLLTLVACGGGGGANSPAPSDPPPVVAPVTTPNHRIGIRNDFVLSPTFVRFLSFAGSPTSIKWYFSGPVPHLQQGAVWESPIDTDAFENGTYAVEWDKFPGTVYRENFVYERGVTDLIPLH